MKKFLSPQFFILFLIIVALFINKEVIFNRKIMFPSNFLVSFYSPWSTEKIKGWEHGIPHKPIGDDQIRIFYPERSFTNEMLANGQIPLWDPYVFSGTPHMANFQSSIFYPLNVVYFFFPQIIAWSFLLIIQPIMAALFMYFLLRLFQLEKGAVWLGSVAFGLSGFIIVWSQENMVVGQAALWLPLALFGIEGFLKTGKRLYFLTAVFAHLFSFFSGFFQVTFYIFVLTFLYSMFRIRSLHSPLRWKNTSLIFSIYLFSLSLSSIQLLPSIEAFLNSPRRTSSAWYLFEGYLLPVTHIFNIFAPDIFGNPGSYNFFGRGFYRETILYIGIIPIFFSVYAFSKVKNNFFIRFFAIAALLSFFLTINSPFTKWFFHLPLPLLPTFLPSRIFIITAFSLAVLSAFGFSTWLKEKEEKDKKTMYKIFILIFSLFLIIFLYAFIMLFNFEKIESFSFLNNYLVRNYSAVKRTDIIVMLKNLVLPLVMLSALLVLIKLKKYSVSAIGIITITLLGQIYFFNKYKISGESEFLYPDNPVLSFLQEKKSIDRFVSFGQPIHENTSTYKHLYSIEGVNPVFPNRYGQLLFAASNNGKLTNDIPRVEAKLSEIGEKTKLSKDNRRLRLLSLLNTKYILYFDGENSKEMLKSKFPNTLFNHVWQKNSWNAFEYKKSLPRVFLGDAYIEKNPQKIVDLIFNSSFDLSKNIILEEKPDINESHKSSLEQNRNNESFAKVVTYEPMKIKILAKTKQPKILFLSDNYYPGWKAYIDKNQTKIYRADYTFRAIYLPKGQYEVTFLYQPESFKWGIYISLISLILLSSILTLPKRFLKNFFNV